MTGRLGSLVLLVLVGAITLLAVAISASASVPVYRFGEFLIDSHGASPPDIDGNIVVWSLSGNIRAYDLATRDYTSVGTGNNYQSCPKISGRWVTWVENKDSHGTDLSIVLKNLDTDQERTVANGIRKSIGCAAIDGNHVVWPDGDGGLWLYDISTDVSTLITNTGYNADPAMDWPWILWRHQDGGSDIWVYDLSATPAPSVVREIHGSGGDVSSGIAAWHKATSEPAGEMDVFGMDLTSGDTFTVTYDSHSNYGPRIDDTFIVYVSDRGGKKQVYLHDLTTDRTYTATSPLHADEAPRISDNTIVWERFVDWPSEWHLYGAFIFEHFSHLPVLH